MCKMVIYPCRTEVETIVGGLQGQVTAVQIKFELVSYEVTIFNPQEGNLTTVWMHESEFVPKGRRRSVGFK